MLSSVRGALKGVTAGFVIVLLTLAFALFGVPELTSFTQKSPIRVGDQGIASQSIQNEFSRAMVNQRNQSEGGFTREQAIASGLPNQIVNSLATRSVVQQEAEKMGLAMPTSLIRDTLSADERFQNPSTGKFDVEVLTALLQNYQYTVRGFEEDMRGTFLREQLIGSIEGGGHAPKPMVDALLLREIEKRDVSYLTMTEEMAGIPEEPSPDKLKKFYSDNPQDFSAPEYRTFTVVSLQKSDFTDGLDAPEEELRKIYDAQKARLYEQPERRTIYQLTFDTEAEATGAIAALEQSASFEKIALDKGMPSLEAVTFTEITKDDVLDPTVSEAAFAADLEEGATTSPVKGLFGWTIVQVANITAPEVQTFEDVRGEIEQKFLEQDTQKRLYDAIDAMEDARDNGAELAEAGVAAGVESKTYGPVDNLLFTPGGAILNDLTKEILDEAFLIDEGEESDANEYADDSGYFFITVSEITPPKVTEYETVEADVESRWRIDERTRRVSRAVQQVRDALSAGASLTEASTPFNAEPISETIARNSKNAVFSEALHGQVFSAASGDVVSGPAPTGDAQTIVVVGKSDFDRAAISAGQDVAFKQFVGYQLDQEFVDAYLKSLQLDYNVRIDQDQIDSLFTNQQ